MVAALVRKHIRNNINDQRCIW